ELAASITALEARLVAQAEDSGRVREEHARLQKELDNLRAGHAAALEAHETLSGQHAQALQELESARKAQDDALAKVAALGTELESWREYSSALNEDRKRLDAELKLVSQLLLDTRGSTSWKATRPLRWVSETLLGRGATPLVPAVQGLREVRFARRTGAPVTDDGQPLAPRVEGALTWGEFSEWVLAKRADYRGVFVQEMVIDWNVPLY